MRVAILVTHLLGTGHLQRASLIADGFARAGHDAIVLSGGFPGPHAAPSHAKLVQLTPLRSDTGFTALFGSDGEADDTLLAARRTEITGALTAFDPHMLITELFPFGRRKLAAEFEAAVAAVPDALIYSSIRDILQYPRKEGRAAEAEARLNRLYDGAFVHGDNALVPLADSWPLPDATAQKTHDTGYVTNRSPAPDAGSPSHRENSTIVSAGGGPVGAALFAAAAQAGDASWHLLVGGHDRDAQIATLKASGSTARIEPTRPDFPALLANADLAILQCGYNAAMDVIGSGVRALFVPFEGDGETEQITRARAFADRFDCGLIREADLTAETLAAEAQRIRITPKPDYSGISLDGVERTVALAESAVLKRFGGTA